jgi:hypothetical protein
VIVCECGVCGVCVCGVCVCVCTFASLTGGAGAGSFFRNRDMAA